jgi:iron complex outermembrane receptor protein
VDTRTWFRGTLRAFTGAQDSKLALYLDSEYQDPLEDRLRRADAIGGDVQLFFDFGRWSLIKLRGSFERDHTAIDLPSVPAEEFVVARQSHALEWEMRPVPEVALLAGASYDLVEGVQSDRGTTAGDLQRINPLGSVTYLPVPDVSITGSYARKTRFPSIEEAYAGPGAEPGLAAEQSDFYELAVRGRVKGTFEGRLAGFRQDIVGVVRTRNAGRRDARLDNAGVVRLQGGEVEADVTPTAGLRLRLAYAFVAAQDLWRDADDDAVDYVPAHRSVLDARYVLPFGLGFGLWSQVTSERHYLAEGQDKLLPWTMVHNVRAFYRYKNNIEAYVAMTNLADAEIEQVPGFPEAGRAFRGGLDVRF